MWPNSRHAHNLTVCHWSNTGPTIWKSSEQVSEQKQRKFNSIACNLKQASTSSDQKVKKHTVKICR